jgi:hypothetical protein
MALDGLSFIDDELQRRGVDPARLSFMLPNMKGGRYSLETPEEANAKRENSALSFVGDRGMGIDPTSLEYKLRVGATSQPRRPVPEDTTVQAPDINASNSQTIRNAGGLSFVNPQPTRPTMGKSEDLLPRERTPQESDAGLAISGARIPVRPTLALARAAGSVMSPRSVDFKTRGGATPDTLAQPAQDAAGLSFVNSQPESSANAVRPKSSFADQFADELTREPKREDFPAQKMALWKKILGGVLSTAAGSKNPSVAGEVARRFFGSPERKAEEQFETAHDDWGRRLANAVKGANLRHLETEDRNIESEIEARNRPRTEKPENLDREAYDYYVSKGMSPADARKRVLQDAQDTKADRPTHTNPFEAFAYGLPEEKQAASDFLEMEHRLSRKYERPTEFEERYRLFKQDPEAYRGMFGDKNATKPDSGTATRMLNYFDKRRKEVNQDFTLDDAQKKEQLDEISKLEKPFMDAVQPGAGGGKGGDRVEVIHPDGRRGSIPRSQLDAAKKKGYREASPN